MFSETGASAFFKDSMHELFNQSLALDDLMFRFIFNMTNGMNAFLHDGANNHENNHLSDQHLMFVVREPFQSKKTQDGLVTGLLNKQSNLIIESYMPTNGVIFSDDIENDFLSFTSGSIATISIAKETARMVSSQYSYF